LTLSLFSFGAASLPSSLRTVFMGYSGGPSVELLIASFPPLLQHLHGSPSCGCLLCPQKLEEEGCFFVATDADGGDKLKDGEKGGGDL
jgi:hypothetical protein